MNKKSLIILGSILGLIVIVAVVIFFVTSKQSKTPSANLTSSNSSSSNSTGNSSNSSTSNVQQPTPTPTPTSGDINQVSGLNKISDSAVVSPILSYDGKAAWYFSSDGRLFKVSVTSGIKQEYVLPKNFDVRNIIWPLTGNDFIVDSGSSTDSRFHYYDSDAHAFVDYPANITSVDFMPDGRHVAYVWASGNKATVSTANFDTSGHVVLADLPAATDVIKVSSDGKKIFAYDAANPSDGKLLCVFADGSKKVITVPTGTDNTAIWSPDGSTFAYYAKDSSGSGSQVWLSQIAANYTTKPTNLSTDLSRAAFNSDGSILYLAIPIDGSKDSIWAIDTKTYEKKQVFANSTSAPVQIKSLLISPDNSTLYFVNSDGFLYSLDISK